MESPDRFLTTSETAKLLNISRRTLESWRARGPGAGPPFVRVGETIRYSLADLHAWLERRRVA